MPVGSVKPEEKSVAASARDSTAINTLASNGVTVTPTR